MARVAKESMWFITGLVEVRLAAADNPDGLSILEHHLAYDFGPPWHVHHHEDETFYLLEGSFRFQLDRDVIEARAGDTLHLPAGVPHGFRVTSPGGGRCLTFTRGGFEQAVREASRPAERDGLPDQIAPTAAQQADLARICAAHGIDLIGPPIA